MPTLKFRPLLLAAVLAIASLGVSTGAVSAYGRADGPLAQIEFSANCNNPAFFLCFPPEQGGIGLGGIWIWIEIDGGPGATSGDADVAGAGCGHIRGVGGGAGSIRGEVHWWWSASPEGQDVSGFLGYPADPHGYYNVALGPGMTFSFPVSQGHYSGHPVPAVAIELQIAP